MSSASDMASSRLPRTALQERQPRRTRNGRRGAHHFVPGRPGREKVTCHVRDKRNSPVSDSPYLRRVMVRPSGAPMLWLALNHPSRTIVPGSSMRAVPLANQLPPTVEVYSQVRFDLIVSS